MMNGYIEAEMEADAQAKTGETLTPSLGLDMIFEGGEVQMKERGDSADEQTLSRRQPNAANTDDTLTANEQVNHTHFIVNSSLSVGKNFYQSHCKWPFYFLGQMNK